MSPVAPTLPAGASLGFSYEYGVDIDLTPGGAPTWQPIRRPSAIVPGVKPIVKPMDTYDDFGAPNESKISESWDMKFEVLVNRLASGAYTPEVEALKSYTEPDAVGDLSVAHLRWYDKPFSGTANPGEAYEGFATVTIDRKNTANSDTGSWAVTLTGKGKRLKIVNPFVGWGAAKPTVTGASPSGAAVGALVTVTGSQFLTATAVKFAAVSAPVFDIVSGSTIVVLVPAGSAGAAAITVTNPTGISDPLTYVRGA